MQTLKFSSVIYGVSQLAGLDRDNLPNHFFKQVRDLANHRLGIAWETEYWPQLIKIDSTAVTTTDSVSSMAYPATAGEILAVYDKDPTKTTALSSVSYILRDDNSDSTNNSGRTINIFSTTSPLFVEYRIVRPELTGDVWETGTTYSGTSSSVQVYHNGEGNFYSTVLSTTNEPDHADWSKVSMPKIFENYLVRGVYADYLRSSGQPNLAVNEDQNAESFLTIESDKLYRQQGQVRTANVVTY
jgi:hypothetical protein